jgi:hypothetical protein
MTWSNSTDLRAQVHRLWDRGELLRAMVSPAVEWPLRLTLKTPTVADVSDRFDSVREWARNLADYPHVRLDWREWNHRVQGTQRLPSAAWVDTLPDAFAMLGKARLAERFQQLWEQTQATQPALLPWLLKRPLHALELSDRWSRLLAVVAWLQAHPRPGVYLRQVDIPGVDTKFIEANRGVLTEWLDRALRPHDIDASATGLSQFNRRYGFLDKPLRIRFRLLDSSLPQMPGCHGFSDITLDADSFAQLALPVQRVFITENETNFLAFPQVAKAIVVFGAGYCWDALAPATWLNRCGVHYWGDIDTHGFAILDRLRSHFPHVVSFLMDRETLMAHREHWGEEPEPLEQALTRLTVEEAALYDELRRGSLQPRLRLEQERVGFNSLRQTMPNGR